MTTAHADYYLFLHGATLARASIQLLYATSLCVAARRSGSPLTIIAQIRHIASEYSDAEFSAMESLVMKDILLAPPMPQGHDDSAIPVPPCAPFKMAVPRFPPGILDRFSPTGEPVIPQYANILASTTPTALAGHLVEFLPPAWIDCVSSVAHEALFVSMLVVDVQRFSPVCIAVAAVYLGLRATGLVRLPTATFWLVLCQRSLHVDLLSVRECAVAMDALCRVHTKIPPYRPVDFEAGVAAAHAALAVAAVALQGGPARAAPAPHCPVTTCRTSLGMSHPASFQAAVLVEAIMAGADPDHLTDLSLAIARDRQQRRGVNVEPLRAASVAVTPRLPLQLLPARETQRKAAVAGGNGDSSAISAQSTAIPDRVRHSAEPAPRVLSTFSSPSASQTKLVDYTGIVAPQLDGARAGHPAFVWPFTAVEAAALAAAALEESERLVTAATWGSGAPSY